MKVAFFYDARIYSDGKDMYSIGFPYEIWQRYLKVFDEIIVCTRQGEKKNQTTMYKLSSGPNVSFKFNTAYHSPLQLFTACEKIKKPIREVVREVDCCIMRLPSVIGLLAIKTAIAEKKPWAVEVVACSWAVYWEYGNLKGKLFAPYMYYMNKKYIKKAPYAIYVSQKFLQTKYPCNGYMAAATDTVISYVNEEVLLQRKAKIQGLTKKSEITLGLIGALGVGFKGHNIAIKAVAHLKNKGYNIKLKCLGGGDASKWQALATKLGVDKDIIFCGVLPGGKAVFNWLDELDIFIMPSLLEGLPRSMVEAMSRGCPIVGSRVGGIPELIEKKCLTRLKDEKDLAAKIETFIINKDFTLYQAERNFNVARQYVKEKTDKVRDSFWCEFKNYVTLARR